MTDTSENPSQPRPVSARRQHRIDLANANMKKHIPQRIGWFHDRGIPADSVRPRAKGASAQKSNALSVGVPIEEVIEQISES